MKMNQKEWTIMIYMAGDNNLAVDMAYAMEQIREVAKDGADSLNLFVYYDGNSPEIPTIYCDFSDAKNPKYVRSFMVPDKLYPVTDGEPSPLELYANEEAGMLCLWNTQPRCPWQTKKYYASEAKILPTNQFLRVHRNQWTTSTETFVPMEWWDACEHHED